MRLCALIAVAVAVSCTRPAPEEARAAPSDVSPQSMRVPQPATTSQVSGLVTKREGGAVLLDSGGPNPIPLRFGDDTEVTVDGKPGTADQIREGDLVRAAYRFDNAGEPFALQVVANSKPVQTDRVKAAPEEGQAQPVQPASQPPASPQQPQTR